MNLSNKVNALLVIVFGSALDAVSSELLDSENFNLAAGLKRLLCIAVVGAVIALCSLYVGKLTKKGNDNE